MVNLINYYVNSIFGIDMIAKQLNQIMKDTKTDSDNEFSREVAIWLKENDESTNIMIDEFFTFEVDEKWLYVRYNNGDKEDQIFYSHVFDLSQIYHITDEV
jgi:hypothetical protein